VVAPVPNLQGYVYCRVHDRGGRAPWKCPGTGCDTAALVMPGVLAGRADALKSRPRRSIATDCVDGHRHRSKLEARVCGRLGSECRVAGDTLMVGVRLPLFSLAPTDSGAPMYATIDFAIVRGGRLHRLIDAKPANSRARDYREWGRGARACESAYGVKVEEVDE
jgi:hypothetical protein